MAITFTCQCGQRFSAREEVQGRATKCPKCGRQFTIPIVKPAGPAPAPNSIPAPAPSSVPPPLEGIPVREAPPPQSACPGCGAGMPLGAVICVNCGYNTKLGRRMETHTVEAAPPPEAGLPAGLPYIGASPSRSRSRSDRRGWIVLDTGLAIAQYSLLIGTIALAILSVFALVGEFAPSGLMSLIGGSRTGGFLGIIASWCGIGLAVSPVALVTGWLVCCGVPERSGARQWIQGTVGCVGLAVASVVLLELIMLAMTPSTPKPGGFSGAPPGGLRSPEDMRKAREDMMAAEKRAENTVTWILRMLKIFTWLACLAWIGSVASFGLFLGAVGQHLGQSALRLWSYGLGGLQGAIALCVTALFFWKTKPTRVMISEEYVDSAGTPGFITILIWGLILATYGVLTFMVYQTRKVVPAD